ncbi:DNA-protecting protein DprA [Bradyrhizobium sp. C-145]|uniref:DNA-processing protein DprA n=1 Tax=Bradyrhizobium sp. C-145 TaxID=574727 RepID=UPI00201B955D|nr:DNA-processing protein DprA [Bradyrhizobium sp. C-145]UQR63207.1 DNA-protecting protein DprA [Bradyrhizobium sp. C-145]
MANLNRGSNSEFGREHEALLALSSIKGIGYWTLYHIGRAGIPYSEVFGIENGEEATAVLRRFGARVEALGEWPALKDHGLSRAAEIIRGLIRRDSSLILKTDHRFPARLLDLTDPPQWIFVEGDPSVLNSNCVAAVGTREPTEEGIFLAQFVGANLRMWGVPTVSGLASGIDQVIHRWSLRMGVPTIAVLGNGLASNYPRGSQDLREAIVRSGGAIVTEYLIHDSYSAENFVRRNRLQAALGSVLIPVEWALKSGTAHTVRFALTMRRPVASLRMNSRAASDAANLPGLHTFEIPGEESEFRHFVTSAISGVAPSSPIQIDMFEQR